MNERVLACRVPRFGGTLIAVKHVLGGGREGGRCGGNEDEGKSLNTRNNNAIKRGWNGNWRIRIQALEIQDSSKRGFRASE